MTLSKAIICDIDNCLSDARHRMHFVDEEFFLKTNPLNKESSLQEIHAWKERVEKWKPDYSSFFAAMGDDGVNEAVCSILEGVTYPRYDESLNREDWEHTTILCVTGRPEKYRTITEEWLWERTPFHSDRDKLFMRPDFLPSPVCSCGYVENPHLPRLDIVCDHCDRWGPGIHDHRPAHIVKREVFEKEIRGKYDVLFVLEDSAECVAMYRELGLSVLQVHI